MPMAYKFDFSIFDSRIVFLYTFQRAYMTTTAFLQPMTAAWGARYFSQRANLCCIVVNKDTQNHPGN